MITAFQNSYIASAIRKTLKFLRMASTPADAFPFEKAELNGTNIEHYIVNFMNGYNAHGTARMQQYKVQELYHCKERTGVGHEYASVKVAGPESSFYIIFERFRGSNDPNKPTASIERSENSPMEEQSSALARTVHSSSDSAIRSGNLIKTSSSASLQDHLADDKASTSLSPTRTGYSNDEIHKIVFFKDPIPLYMVVVLAGTVHRFQVKYDLSESSCYFYAAAIMEVMQRFYSMNISDTKYIKSRWAELGKVPLVKKTPVSWVYSAPKTQPEGIVQSLITSYKADLEKFEKNVRLNTFVEAYPLLI